MLLYQFFLFLKIVCLKLRNLKLCNSGCVCGVRQCLWCAAVAEGSENTLKPAVRMAGVRTNLNLRSSG